MVGLIELLIVDVMLCVTVTLAELVREGVVVWVCVMLGVTDALNDGLRLAVAELLRVIVTLAELVREGVTVPLAELVREGVKVVVSVRLTLGV